MNEIKFKPGTRTAIDEWTVDGEKISAPEKLAAIKVVVTTVGPVLVEHGFLRGARAPATLAFDDYGDLIEYLTANARAGDSISVWSLGPFMRDTAPLASGKCPDEDGAVPKGGPY
jgi:hypothetical protein